MIRWRKILTRGHILFLPRGKQKAAPKAEPRATFLKRHIGDPGTDDTKQNELGFIHQLTWLGDNIFMFERTSQT